MMPDPDRNHQLGSSPTSSESSSGASPDLMWKEVPTDQEIIPRYIREESEEEEEDGEEEEDSFSSEIDSPDSSPSRARKRKKSSSLTSAAVAHNSSSLNEDEASSSGSPSSSSSSSFSSPTVRRRQRNKRRKKRKSLKKSPFSIMWCLTSFESHAQAEEAEVVEPIFTEHSVVRGPLGSNNNKEEDGDPDLSDIEPVAGPSGVQDRKDDERQSPKRGKGSSKKKKKKWKRFFRRSRDLQRSRRRGARGRHGPRTKSRPKEKGVKRSSAFSKRDSDDDDSVFDSDEVFSDSESVDSSPERYKNLKGGFQGFILKDPSKKRRLERQSSDELDKVSCKDQQNSAIQQED